MWTTKCSWSRCSNDTSWELEGGGRVDRLLEKSGNKCETAQKSGKKQLISYFSILLYNVQAICFKKPVENLNSCQIIVRQKRCISPSYCTGDILQEASGKFVFLSNNCSAKKAYFSILLHMHLADNFKKIDCCSNQFVKYLTARIKNFGWHFKSNKFAKMQTFFNCFCYT
jgi:hypothetical protein